MRPRASLLALAAGAAAAWGAVSAAPAPADFTAPQLVSGSNTAQADYGAESVISADGGYVVFVGSYLGQVGIWRRNLQTGALDYVAGGDANAPSVSADGRYISFTTTAGDLPTGGGPQTCPSVYVRDMSVLVSPGAFTLASAIDGLSSTIRYGGDTQPSKCFGGGSAAAPRVALSADGNEVAFTVDGQSNLTTGGTNLFTPPAQVAVRYIAQRRTVLVSQTMGSLGSTSPQPVLSGAALTNGTTQDQGYAGQFYADPDSTAAISADGSTVAWQGINIPSQAPASSADAPPNHPVDYSEPLWRRIADGSGAPIRRVTGGDDPVGPCPGGCTGPLDTHWNNSLVDPLTLFNGLSGGTLTGLGLPSAATPLGLTSALAMEDATPQLSADGSTVAILSTQPSTGQAPPCGSSFNCGSTETTNAFVVNMAPGLSRTQALTRVTQWANDNFGTGAGPNPFAGTLDELAISPEGTRVAFTTIRTVFPWSPPALITPQLGPVTYEQLYVADLAAGTLEVASLGYDGQPANGNVASPSFSAANGPIAFSSAATNLVYGALSSKLRGYEVFTTRQLKPPAVPGASNIGALPRNPAIVPDWRIGATAQPSRDGAIIVTVTVPGAGRLRAAARAGVPVRRLARVRPGAARSPGTRGRAGRVGGPPRRVVTVTLARAHGSSFGAGVIDVRLAPAARYRPLIAGIHGLYATLTVSFAAPGHRTLVVTLPVDFRAHRRHGPRRSSRSYGRSVR